MRKRILNLSEQNNSELQSFARTTMSSAVPQQGETDEQVQAKKPPAYTSSLSLSRDDKQPRASLHEINASPVNYKSNTTQQQQQQQSGPLQNFLSAEPQAPQIPSATTASSSSSSSSSSTKAPNERKMFFAFIKVLLKYLEKAEVNALRNRAKAIIAECTVRNRNGDADYLCLQGAIERRLQQSLGAIHWDRAQLCYHKFLERCRMPSAIEVTSSACV